MKSFPQQKNTSGPSILLGCQFSLNTEEINIKFPSSNAPKLVSKFRSYRGLKDRYAGSIMIICIYVWKQVRSASILGALTFVSDQVFPLWRSSFPSSKTKFSLVYQLAYEKRIGKVYVLFIWKTVVIVEERNPAQVGWERRVEDLWNCYSVQVILVTGLSRHFLSDMLMCFTASRKPMLWEGGWPFRHNM